MAHDILLIPSPQPPSLLLLELLLRFLRTCLFSTGSMPSYVNHVAPRDYLRICDCFVQVAILSSVVGLNSRGLVSPTSDGVLASSCVLFNHFTCLHHSQVTTQTEIRAGITTWVRAVHIDTDMFHVANNYCFPFRLRWRTSSVISCLLNSPITVTYPRYPSTRPYSLTLVAPACAQLAMAAPQMRHILPVLTRSTETSSPLRPLSPHCRVSSWGYLPISPSA
jgi:hypothetical protein